ncbi:MAG: DUF1156 domain-containing protein [Acidimicrobiia bacterium]|nr:DUF1156 domain-containing protein [Acidimicrobiia bacterium]
MTPEASARKKLIEVALPLEAINREAAREKSIRHGHPSTLHLWWARRPLAACRAVLFAQLVDDPSSHPDRFPDEEAQAKERQRLFEIIERLVPWESSNDPFVLADARAEILASCDGEPPAILDPFCGGGSIPLEAQRLGLEAHASDLNPVPVLITKALIEVPPRFAGAAAVHPGRALGATWTGTRGLAEDVRWYGQWMRDKAWERIGHLYPKVELPEDQGGGEATVVAWIWARTVTCPNPACGATMPLISTFWLSKKKDRRTWIEPHVDDESMTVRFKTRTGAGDPPPPPKIGRGANFRCLACGQTADDAHVKSEGMHGRMDAQLVAVVAEGVRQRVYLPATSSQAEAAALAEPSWRPDGDVPARLTGGTCYGYGLTGWGDLFTDRQLVALTTFSDLVHEVREQVHKDAVAAGMTDDTTPLVVDGMGALAYADAVVTYLGLAVDKLADRHSSICSWDSSVKMEGARNTFARQAIPMVWDFAESNPFSDSSGNWAFCVDWVAKAVERVPATQMGVVNQLDASAVAGPRAVVATDPPYYDNIGYADLSDFFYVWVRRTLKDVYPDLFSTVLTPKAQELIASPYRHGGKREAEQHFESGLRKAFESMREVQDPSFPLTLFYAFKQAETDGANGSVASTGWDTMLEGLLAAGFCVTATWPMRSELSNRPTASGTNALASSIVLACRLRPEDAPIATRRDFLAELKSELPGALRRLQEGSVAPVDLAQASIGPGMAVFSRYARVLEPDGSRMPVRTALVLINQVLDEILAEQESEFDSDTRWAIAWFEQHGLAEGSFGDADNLARAKNTAVDGLARAGIVRSGKGSVRLLHRNELPEVWDPGTDDRLPIWEVTQHLIRALEVGGERAASDLAARIGGLGEVAKELAYRLYVICDRKGRSEEAQAYNALVIAWPEICRLAQEGML